jgi:hypothetical protein
MVRSPAFGSTTATYSDALFALAFASAPAFKPLTLLHTVTRRPLCKRYASGIRIIALRLLVGTRFQVLFHSPNRGSFHLSLALLSLSVAEEYLALGGGPPRFTPGSTCLALLGIFSREWHFAYGAVTLYGQPFQTVQLDPALLTLAPGSDTRTKVPRPQQHKASGPWCFQVWAFPRSLAATEGIEVSFYSSGTEMFQFPG